MGNDEPKPTGSSQVTLPQRDTVTHLQVQTLLGALNNVMHALHHAPVRRDDDESKPLYSEASIAAQTTFIKICARLDSIVDDSSRWNFETQETLEANLDALYKQNIAYLKEKTEHIKNLNLPHRRTGAKMGRLDDGSFVCFLGDSPDEAPLVGVGNTPAEAQRCFDMLFNGEVPTSLTDWLSQPKQRQNAKDSMDSSGNSKTDETPNRGDADGPDSGGA